MKNDRRFDEVMIVNPYDPASGAGEGANVMQFHYTPGYGYYAAGPYGYYAQPWEGAQWGEPDVQPVGYYADDPYGYYADNYSMGYYGEPVDVSQWGEPDVQPVGYYADDPYGYYADEQPMGYYADEYYGDVPEMVGWGEPETPMGYYGEPPIEGYVRDVPPTFNAGCPMPTNVAGFGDQNHFDGYVKPSTVNATCQNFAPQPGTAGEVPETFRPLW